MHRSTRCTAILVLAVALAACSGEANTHSTGSQPSPTEVPPTEAPPSDAATATESIVASSSEPAAASTSTSPAQPADALLAAELTDVRSGETFTLGELAATSGPVLLEPMAVWCSNCRAQQHEVLRAHEAGDFTSVSLDVDLSESPEDLAAYADREGFVWHFAMADAYLYRALQERFGVAVTNPPSTPLIVIAADGTVRPLEFGRGTRGAEELLAELAAG
jgi:hypothetical protein